jgi:hypothetical protein
MNQADLPDRMREKAFQRFEPDIIAIVQAYPMCVELDPSRLDLAPTTYCARLRDAMTSLREYRWATAIDMTRFDSIWNKIQVSHTRLGVLGGSREAILRRLESTDKTLRQLATPPSNSVQFQGLDKMIPICELAAKGNFTPILIIGITDEHVAVLEADYDIRLDKQPDGNYILS